MPPSVVGPEALPPSPLTVPGKPANRSRSPWRADHPPSHGSGHSPELPASVFHSSPQTRMRRPQAHGTAAEGSASPAG